MHPTEPAHEPTEADTARGNLSKAAADRQLLGLSGPDPAADDIAFNTPDLIYRLEALTNQSLDGLSFGLVSMARDGTIEHYNKCEATMTGLQPDRTIGRHFFTAVAPCTNNFMIAYRFKIEETIDDVVDYVFTFIMAPMRVRLRLLKHPEARRIYLAVQMRP